MKYAARLVVLAGLTIPASVVYGATFTVSNLNDSGPGSLRQAILEADQSSGPHTITIATSGTISLASALPVLNQNLANEISIEGPGAANLTIDGGDSSRVLFVDQGDVTIKDVTISNGRAQGGDGADGGGGGLGAGGGLFVNSSATVTVEGVEFANNSAVGGQGGDAASGASGGGGGGLGGDGGATGGSGGGGGGGFAGSGGASDSGGGEGGGLNNNGNDASMGIGGTGGSASGGNGGNSNQNGEDGLAFGGGGGAGSDLISGRSGGEGGGDGGDGGFGGGGGAGGSGATSGNGGFGAGGGGGSNLGTAGNGGMYGGAGAASNVTSAGGGGGGAGLGGAVFVRSGGTLILRDTSINGSSVVAGSAGTGGDGATPGQAHGEDLFLNGTVGQIDVTTGTQTLSGSISGSGSLTKLGDGTLVLTGNNNYSGGTLVSGGTLEGNTTSLQGDINNNANVTFNQTADGTFSSVIGGTGTVTKTGAGTLVLSGANTYAGGTIATGGTLAIASDSNIGSGGLTLDAATLRTDVAISTTRNVTLGVGGGTFDTNGSDIVANGIFSGPGGLTKTGTGRLSLFGTSNSWMGGTTISAGDLHTQTTSLPGDVVNNSQLTFDQDFDGTFAGVISGNGLLVKDGTGIVTLTGANTYTGGSLISAGGILGTTSSLIGDITNNSLLIFEQDTDGTFAGAITGSGSLTKRGTGEVILSGANSFSGGITISAGTLRGSTASLPGDIANDAALIFDQDGDGTFAGVISGSGSFTKLGTGTVVLSGANTFTGGTTISAGALDVTTASLPGDVVNNASLILNQSFDGTFAGAITGSGSLTKDGSGIVTLTGMNLFSGGTFINGGGLSVASDDLLGDVSGGIAFDGGTLVTTADLSTSRDTHLEPGGGIIDTQMNNVEHSGTVSGTVSGTGHLTKRGDGTLTLSGANSYSGGTAIEGGSVVIDKDSRLGDASGGIEFDDGTLTTTESFGTNRNVVLNAGGGTIDTQENALVFSGVFSGAGDFSKQGAGSLTMAGNSTYTGTTNVDRWSPVGEWRNRKQRRGQRRSDVGRHRHRWWTDG